MLNIENVYALVKDGIVINTILLDNPSQELLNLFKEDHSADEIIPASINTMIGGEYDGNLFWTLKPYPTWIKEQSTNKWIPPIPYPVVDELDPKSYLWSEEEQQWIEISNLIPEDVILPEEE